MAPGLTTNSERRGTERVTPDSTAWRKVALLRPGQDVLVINLSPGGALVESPTRLNPGVRTELQLFGIPRRVVRGRIERCRVARLEPLCYEGAIVFEERLEIAAKQTTG